MSKAPYRPRLSDQENKEPWEKLVDVAKEHSPEEVLQRFFRTFNNSKESIDISEDGLDYIVSSESERVKTKEDLIEATEVNENEYEIYRYITNKWDQHSVDKGLVELYQVKLWMKKKYLDKPDATYYNKWLDGLESVVEPVQLRSESKKKPIVLAIADPHVGAIIEGERLVPDYNIEEIEERFAYIASVVNSYDRPVHVKILGDFIESFTGKSHKDTWKQIEQHGMEVALTAFDIVRGFLIQLNDVKDVDIVGGNHDRISSSNEDDKSGQVAYLIAEMLDRFTDLNVAFEPRLLTSKHDGVCYILTHGDKRITKTQPAQLVLEYGDQDLFNVMLNAHGHEEKIHKNSIRFQARQIPPITVPNQYALDNGWSSQSGFTIIEPSDRAGVNLKTYAL